MVMPFESVVLTIEVHSFAIRHHDGLYRQLNLQAENPRLKISATRRVTQHHGSNQSENVSTVNIAASHNVVLSPFGVNQIDEGTSVIPPSSFVSEGVSSTVRRRNLPTPRKSADMEMEPYFGHVASSEVSSSGASALQPSRISKPSAPELPMPPQRHAATGAHEPSPQPTTPPTSRTAAVDREVMAKPQTAAPKIPIVPNPTVFPRAEAPIVPWGDEQNQRVHVLVRPRPKTPLELEAHHGDEVWIQTEKSIGDAERTYLFDGVLNCSASNRDVHELAGVQTLMEGVARGVNACMLLYGQTNSGKTHTLFGSFVDQGHHETSFVDQVRKEQGLLYFALHSLFRFIRHSDGDTCTLSLFEVYNEEVRDLFADSVYFDESGNPVRHKKAQLLFDPISDGFLIDGLIETPFSDLGSGLALLSVGLTKVTLGVSHINDRSSRAHTICKVKVYKSNRSHDQSPTTSSEVFFVDLAGSESLAGPQQQQAALDAEISSMMMSSLASGSGALKQTAAWTDDFSRVKSAHHISRSSVSKRETANINLSLTSLKKCILELSRQQRANQQQSRDGSTSFRKSGSMAARPSTASRPSFVGGFIPFRDSVLTKILKTSLSGNSRVLMICTVSLSDMNYRETKATLAFGTLAKSVTTSAFANTEHQSHPNNGVNEKLKALENENVSLKEQIANLEAVIMAHTREISLGSNMRGLLTDAGGSAPRDSLPNTVSLAPSGGASAARASQNVDATHLVQFEASEKRLGELVADTLKYLADGVRALILVDQSTSVPLLTSASRGGTAQPPLPARGGAQKDKIAKLASMQPFSRTQSSTTPRYQVTAAQRAAPVVRAVTLRLKLPQGRFGGEVIVVDGLKQYRVKIEDMSRVVLGKNFPELRAAATATQAEEDAESAAFIPTKTLASVSIFPFSSVGISTNNSPRLATKDPLLTFLCSEESDLEGWVIALAHLSTQGSSSGPGASSTSSAVSIRTTNVFMSSLDAAKGSGASNRSVAPPTTSTFLRSKSSSGGLPSQTVRRPPILFSWDINTIARNFPYAVKSAFQQQPSSRTARGQLPSFVVLPRNNRRDDIDDSDDQIPTDVDLLLAQLSEKELLLCKQHNIDLAEYLQTRSFILGDVPQQGTEGQTRRSMLISLYDIRLSCPVSLYQAFVVVKFLRDQRLILDLHAYLSSGFAHL
ncbi:kinesin-like protein, putative [Bodo saltans]|uniref:Kinesin-like protein, putative n=1 Tax=Bodo saltans TaxID=75058 RepID=A0A0S4KHB2_BODSA|nr:kinesin-like protein, putative [Bodo saltans]|eukprot:CUI12702.1 kinesin-like protein, putative [Bodo saltans]